MAGYEDKELKERKIEKAKLKEKNKENFEDSGLND